MKPNKQMRRSIEAWKNNPIAPKGVVPKCIACDGSGYYDTQRHGKTPKCGSCKGTGLNNVV